MTHIYNQKTQTNLRKKLRNNQTSSEIILWNKLRRNQVNNHRFRRQFGLGKFVADFYCRELRLVIEVDGANHFFDKKSADYDISRQEYIESLGIRVLRFTSTDVYHHLDDVMNEIYETTFLPPLRPALSEGRSSSPPYKGGEKK